MSYFCDICKKRSGKLWITDDAIWNLLPRRYRKLRLCLPHFRKFVRIEHPNAKKLAEKKTQIEARYERLKQLGKYKPFNYAANRRERERRRGW